MGKSRILIIQLKEIIYTAIILLFAILLVIALTIALKKDDTATNETMSSSETILFTPGVYTTELSLNDNIITLEITLDESVVKSLELKNMNDSVSQLYPLLETSLKNIEDQLKAGVSVSDVQVLSDSKYTHELLLNSINKVLSQAKA